MILIFEILFFGNESYLYKRFYKIKEKTYCLYRKNVLSIRHKLLKLKAEEVANRCVKFVIQSYGNCQLIKGV